MTAAGLGLDSLLAEELDSLEGSLLAEDELVVGVLEVVEDAFSAAVFAPEAVAVWVVGVVAPVLVERAGSCPEASCT